MDAAASPWPDPRPIGPPSKAVDTQALLDPRITQELPTLHRIAHDTVPSALAELDARLVKLGVSKLGQRLRMKTALIAAESLPALIGMVKKAQEASDAGKPIPAPAAAPAGDGNDSDSSIGSEFDEPEKEPEDLPNSNYAEEASALNSNMPWREEMKQDYGINIQPWWIVTGDRLAVRSAPSKGAKALGVWRKGTIVKVEHVVSKLDLSGATSWVRLGKSRAHAHLGLSRSWPRGAVASDRCPRPPVSRSPRANSPLRARHPWHAVDGAEGGRGHERVDALRRHEAWPDADTVP